MQKTRFQQFIYSFFLSISDLLSTKWSKRSIFILSVLFGYYFTNSLISFLLDKSVNTVFLAILILLIMELSIRSISLFRFSKILVILQAINNFRIGSTYALILEAFKLGS
tara:strand:- start:378 stop:707 length:330 start_codon:yes stop_codon:yes gene_type:complete